MKKVLIMTPCYNEEATIDKFYEEVVGTIKKEKLDERYEIHLLFVSDGSTDRTNEIIKQKSTLIDVVRNHYIILSRNFWKESAILAGLNFAKKFNFDAVVMMDTDLQDDPAVLPVLFDKWEEGYQHIYTKHKNRQGEPFLKKILSKLFYKIYALLTGNKNLARGARDYSLLDKRVVDAFLSFPDQDRFTKGISSWVGFKKYCVEFEHKDRSAGKTKMNYKRLFKYAFTGFNQFSTFLKLFPTMMILFSLAFITGDIVNITVNRYNLDFMTYYNDTNLRIGLLSLGIAIMFKVVVRMIYDVKKQATNRPQYLIQDCDYEE